MIHIGHVVSGLPEGELLAGRLGPISFCEILPCDRCIERLGEKPEKRSCLAWEESFPGPIYVGIAK